MVVTQSCLYMCAMCKQEWPNIMYTYKMLCYVRIFYIGSCLYIHIYIYIGDNMAAHGTVY